VVEHHWLLDSSWKVFGGKLKIEGVTGDRVMFGEGCVRQTNC